MNRKAIPSILTMLLVLTLFISCSDDLRYSERTAELSFTCSSPTTRSLSRKEPELAPENFWWTYEAVKTDGSGLSTGRTQGETKLNGGNKGLGGAIGPFSLGNWTFTLRAYAASDNGTLSKQVYEGKAIGFRIDRTVKAVPVKVAPRQAEEGYISLSATLAPDGKDCTLTYLGNGSASPSVPETSGGSSTWTVKSGPWKVSITGGADTKPTEICINVFDWQTTKVDGTTEVKTVN